ncbi:8738d077-9ddf-4aa7-98b9-38b28fec9065 [Thermothielavioides terrestris]|uniref:8738d077-9ddf-4aa7-98b9-38b28fec9065 n=1 Tax=Thermothielavioides terrestris TaxID=2587410 RepID=A0A446BJX0_9PEZI|nr:8738d077-9ddf-4aa7-98b9-38b28fec9065 [Thermothielavioides terrestris]
MSSGQAGSSSGTQGDTDWKAHPPSAQQQPDTTDRHNEVHQDCLSPELRALLEQGAEEAGLEVDEDEDEDEAEVDEADSNEDNARSVYAVSMYPVVQPSHRVERPYENGQDSATIDSSRTLYAEDFDFVVENGRQYCGDYFLPIDQTEQTRQYVIHQVFLKLFDLELTTVPLENPRYILDIGTGIGEWAIGMAERYPRSEVFGTDIAPIQPTNQVPFNVEFHIENAEEEWIHPANTADLVHLRNMDGAFSDWALVYREAFTCVKPGGWIEVVDWENFLTDKSFLSFFPEGSPPRILAKAWLEAAEAAGKLRDAAHANQALLKDAGFVDIRETVYTMDIGPPESSSSGKFWLYSIVTGIEAFCLRMLTKHLGWDPDEVRDLCDKAAREMQRVAENPGREEAFVMKVRVVVARKPVASTLNGNHADAQTCSGDESTIGARTIRSEDTL